MKRSTLFALLLLAAASPAGARQSDAPLNVYNGPIPEGVHTYYVAPGGDDVADGTEAAPWATLAYAVTKVQRGDVVVMRGGVYPTDRTITISAPSGYTDEMIVVTAYPGEVPVLDFSSMSRTGGENGVRLNANGWHLIGLTIRSAAHNGIRMDGSYNILEQITAYENGDTGIHMAGGASYNLVKNSDSFRNYDAGSGGQDADGFGAKFDIGPGNRYVGNRGFDNSDDGWDFWKAQTPIEIDSCWAFNNGNAAVFGNPAGFEGNGNGFKLGGDYVIADHVVKNSLSFHNLGASENGKGFDYNNNPGAMTLIGNTAYGNPRNYIFAAEPRSGQAVYLNNLSADADLHAVVPASAVQAGNSWQLVTDVPDDVFLSVDTTGVRGPRRADGSLPDLDFLKPAPGTFLVDGGVVLAEPYYGAAPDVGAYEYVSGDLVLPWVVRGSGAYVADLMVYDAENAAAWSVETDLGVGTDPYGDGAFTIAALPDYLVVDEWIRAASASRSKNHLFPAAAFVLTRPGQVIIAHADEVDDKPAWLSDFEAIDAKIILADGGGNEHALTLFRREVEAGEVVTLGRNSWDGTTEVPMYIAMVGTASAVAIEYGPERFEALPADVYPNPVRGTATITFGLDHAAEVSIRVFDPMGREAARVVDGFYGAGTHTASFDARSLPGGVYYCHLVAGGRATVRTLVRLP